MAKHLATGRLGEDLAARWLQERGYRILHRNWKYSYYELDLVAEKNGMLHFIEVKTRRTDTFGYPEEGVTIRKMERLLLAGEAYQEQYPHWKRLQYHILSIRLYANREPDYFLLEDVSL
ncbi:MAG TPA: YraN family protein [Lacibacter sp.]|nr:YraN family protein [Lacibacter sp.]HMO90265.1 YraN family protein [Lacibacter sp.]HMP87209.1 YraN family protein [Lacibacter sp.]